MIVCPHLHQVFDKIVAHVNFTWENVLRSDPIPAYNSKKQFGYIHTLSSGYTLLICDNAQPYLIPEDFAEYYDLQTGDYLEGYVEEMLENHKLIVRHIERVVKINYDNAETIAATQNFLYQQHKIKLGTTAVVRLDYDTDVPALIDEILGQAPASAEKMILAFDGRRTNYNPKYYLILTTPIQNNRNKLSACLYAFFKAKDLAAQGKDVVLLIDSLDKMFTTFNNCMQLNGLIKPNEISQAASMDLESMLCSSANLKDGGSFTIIGLHRPGLTGPQQYITERFYQLFDTII